METWKFETTVNIQRQLPPPPNYVKGLSTVHKDIDNMDINVAQMDKILLSSGDDDNFHVSRRQV